MSQDAQKRKKNATILAPKETSRRDLPGTMTLLACWVRNVRPDSRELWIAADSRLTGGLTWDSAQKLFPLSRQDSVLAFTGETGYAYPLVTQIVSYISSYEKAASRALDLTSLKGHVSRLINDMKDVIEDSVDGDRLRCELVLAGFDWRSSAFRVNALDQTEAGEYRLIGAQSLKRVPKSGEVPPRLHYRFFGTEEAVDLARETTSQLVADRKAYAVGMDREPLSALVQVIESGAFRDVGGAPQIVKIYPHPNAMPLNVRWQGRVYFLGRRLLEYETNRYLIYCVESGKTLSWDQLRKPDVATPERAGGDNAP